MDTNKKTKDALKRLFLLHPDEGKKVLEFLRNFAKMDDFCFCSDMRAETYLNGRRSVVAEIERMLNEED